MGIKYKTNTIELANKLGFTPQEIEAFATAFDFISRFAVVNSKKDLENIVMEIEDGKNFIYEEIPTEVKRVCNLAFEKNGSVGKFYNSYDKTENNHLEKFIKNMAEQKKQPKEFFSEGVMTLRALKRGSSTDNTVEVAEYQE